MLYTGVKILCGIEAELGVPPGNGSEANEVECLCPANLPFPKNHSEKGRIGGNRHKDGSSFLCRSLRTRHDVPATHLALPSKNDDDFLS
jgi:hypothetical protein